MANTQTVLGRLRRLIVEVDEVTSDLTDQELLLHLEDARATLELRKIAGMSELAVGSIQDQTGYGIIPDPTLELGEMMALQAASEILEAEFRGRVFRGELGVSWQSGVEQESTITAARMYADAIGNIRGNLESLVLIKLAPTSGTRPQ